MSTEPKYVEYAFNAIRVIGIEEIVKEDIKAFAKRWGGLDLVTFAHVLHHAQGKDQMVATFAIGHTHSAWAKEQLLPFLSSNDPGVRWAAALSLGDMRDTKALPVLIGMLQEFLPPPYISLSEDEVESDWFEAKHLHVAGILGQWGDPALIPVLRDTLARVWLVEQQAPAHEDPQLWWHYQEALAYALGQLGALDRLKDLDLPAFRRRLWTIYMLLGYLNAQEQYRRSVTGIIQEITYFGRHQELRTLLLQVLQQKLGLLLPEAKSFIEGYNDD